MTLLHAFCDQTKTDLEEYVPQLIRSLILLFTDKDQVSIWRILFILTDFLIIIFTIQEVLKEAWNALNAVTKTLDAGAQMSHVPDVRQAVRFEDFLLLFLASFKSFYILGLPYQT